ncbi:hypothetical protein Acsp01_76270 [Actinoplanes sp. NBRC 101535]|nr:hypothetical protein Acsp01_76270 [Actinoplanes sp. NBRC 101535]
MVTCGPQHGLTTGVVIWGAQRARIHHTHNSVVISGVQRARIHHTARGVVNWASSAPEVTTRMGFAP